MSLQMLCMSTTIDIMKIKRKYINLKWFKRPPKNWECPKNNIPNFFSRTSIMKSYFCNLKYLKSLKVGMTK